MSATQATPASAQAGASQTADPATPAATPGAQNRLLHDALEQLTELTALSQSAATRYAEQVKLSGQMAKAELRLTGRSLTVAAGLIVCLGAGLVLLWGSVLLGLGYLVFQFSGSLAITATTLLLLQFAVLYWCWRSLDYVLSQVGFSQTWRQLKRLLLATEEPGNAD